MKILNILFICFLNFGMPILANDSIDKDSKGEVVNILEDTHEQPSLKEVPAAKKSLNVLTKDIKQTTSERLFGVFGLCSILFLGVLFSNNRKKISWSLVGYGLLLQVALALLVLKLELGRMIFDGANDVIVKILGFSNEGARFIFGNLVGMNVPVGVPISQPATMSPLSSSGFYANVGAFFAFSVLPTIIFFSALTALLYYFGILQAVVRGIAKVMQKTLKISGAESFSAAANIFVGQTEAPLLVRPFLKDMTKSEIMAIMTGGFATVSGGVLAAFVGMLNQNFPEIAGHLLAASVMSAPASLVMAKIMWPESETPKTMSAQKIVVKSEDSNLFDAISRGTSDGLMLCLNVGAMLIAFVSLIAFLNWILGAIGGLMSIDGLSLDSIFSFLFSPIAFLLGVPWEDAPLIGNVLGMKTAVNEFVAYLELSDLLSSGALKSPKSAIIAAYALCGFANFGSIGIQIGGLSALEPSRRHDFAKIGFRAMIAGTFACFQTAALAGILL